MKFCPECYRHSGHNNNCPNQDEPIVEEPDPDYLRDREMDRKAMREEFSESRSVGDAE